MRTRLAAPIASILCATALAACGNAGEDRVLSIQATGSVTGLVYLDRNGNRVPDGLNVDTALAGVGVRLVIAGTRDTAARATSDAQGLYHMTAVPVGHYLLVVDTATVGDSVDVVRIDTNVVTLTAADSADTVRVAIAFPTVTVAQARALPLGKKAFIVGVALNSVNGFGDSTVHIADASGTIRGTRIPPGPVFPGDSMRFLGTRRIRDGQPTLDSVATFYLGPGNLPAGQTVTNTLARTANGGALDAGLVRVTADTILDTATVVVGPDSGDFQLHVFDGTDTLIVLFDHSQFSVASLAPYIPGAAFTIRGLLLPVPPGNTGFWRLKPRYKGVIGPGGAGGDIP